MEKVTVGQRVIACNTVAWHKRSPGKLFAIDEFMEEGVIVKAYHGKISIAKSFPGLRLCQATVLQAITLWPTVTFSILIIK